MEIDEYISEDELERMKQSLLRNGWTQGRAHNFTAELVWFCPYKSDTWWYNTGYAYEFDQMNNPLADMNDLIFVAGEKVGS